MASEIVSGVSGAELKRHLNEIAQYVRLSGTDDEAKAGIRARLATCGEIQP